MEAPILWSPDVKNWPTGKDLDAQEDWRQKEKGVAEGEMVGWHHYSVDMNLSKLQEIVKDRGAWRAAVHGITKSQTGLSDWRTIAKWYIQRFWELGCGHLWEIIILPTTASKVLVEITAKDIFMCVEDAWQVRGEALWFEKQCKVDVEEAFWISGVRLPGLKSCTVTLGKYLGASVPSPVNGK